MKEQPEALRLAAELEDEHYPWPRFPAAAELRRLHEENEALREANETFGKRQEWWNDKMVELEAQRDALLEALRAALAEHDQEGPRWGEWVEAARAAIDKAEKA